MLNRPPVEGLEFSLVTVVAAVVPASIRAAFIGSVLSASVGALMTLINATRFWQWTADFAGEMLIATLAVIASTLFVGALIGIAYCGFYLIAVGVPLAWLLRERLGTNKGLVALIATAPVAAYLASGVLGVGPMNWATHVDEWAFALACAYSVPAAFYFHRDILTARRTSPFAED